MARLFQNADPAGEKNWIFVAVPVLDVEVSLIAAPGHVELVRGPKRDDAIRVIVERCGAVFAEEIGGRVEHGLSELITGRIVPEEAVRPVPDVANLDFISCGARPPHPSDLLMHPAFAGLLQRFSTQYDLVVLDSPPILVVTDAAVVGRHVGTCLLVVRYGLNQANEVEMAKERLAQSGVAVDGVIFNALERRKVGYSVYGGYGNGIAA